MAEYRLTVPITVRSLTQRADLGLVLSAGEVGASRTIKWAHAIELNDPTPYLFGGELVMTTGLTVGLSHAEQYAYAARLSEKNVAALAFDTGTTFTEVPAGILAAGDELGLPILQVPVRTPFIAITRAVIDELTADELRAVQRVVDQQDVLVRATLRDGAPGVVSALSRSLAATVIVTATDGTLLAEAGNDAEHLAEITRRAFPDDGRKHASRVVADREGYCTIQTVRAGKAERGYLAVRSEDALTAAQRLLVSHAMALIAIELEKPARVADAEQRLRAAVTRALLADPATADPGVLRYFGFDPDTEVVVVVLSNIGSVLPGELHVSRYLTGGAPFLMSAVSGEIVVVLAAKNARRAADLHRSLGTALGRSICAGISRRARLGEVQLALRQARSAARAHPDGRVTEFDDRDIYSVLLGGREPGELALLAQSLAPLLGDDSDTTLLGTLESFLTCNGQMETAALSLGVHRHTMRNRIARITALLDCDLQSADIRAALWIAIRARALLG